jgi:DNA uptake protein ComE-like DNA-binding protein
MNTLKRFFSEWFGYSRGERRATMILIIIIAIVILVRYLIPEKKIDIEVQYLMPPIPSEEQIPAIRAENENVSLTYFDPNTASFGDLTSLGIPGKVAGTLIRYRNSGGKFRKPEDIMKVYGMDSVLGKTLIPYINIAQPPLKKSERQMVAASAPETEAVSDFKLEINGCDSSDLELLPGIGKVLSARMIKYRELLGGYAAVDQLKEVYGLADSTYQTISVRCTADSSLIRRIRMNSASFSDLNRHPYIERYEAQAIIKYRDLAGRIKSISQLVSEKILTGDKARKLSPYLSFE